jgi:hypothetical protein
VCSEKLAMECRQVSTLEHEGERWNCALCALCAVRKWLWNAGRWALWSTKLNDETRRLGQSSKRSAAVRGQADVGRVRPSRSSGFSACQVLWPIAGRSASRAAVGRTSSLVCATRLSLHQDNKTDNQNP